MSSIPMEYFKEKHRRLAEAIVNLERLQATRPAEQCLDELEYVRHTAMLIVWEADAWQRRIAKVPVR